MSIRDCLRLLTGWGLEKFRAIRGLVLMDKPRGLWLQPRPRDGAHPEARLAWRPLQAIGSINKP